QLQNMSVNDGEGIRTNIFLAGCPMTCPWCSNPEGRTLINPMTKITTVDEVVTFVKKQMLFYRYSGGGVTFSGGEATVQAEFLRSMTNAFYDRGISLAIETCGAFAFPVVKDILAKMDTIFIDIKHMDPVQHKKWTGYALNPILENICSVDTLQSNLVIRVPLIVGVNADEENLVAILNFLRNNLRKPQIEFLPYHTYGEEKYRQLGKALPDVNFHTPTEEEQNLAIKLACAFGVEVVSYR
ncbi:MAG: glycyl-radical enzyme activating protein, partial [Acidaminococcaceae bacterium]|nr:glycyl-radical enzyme activating protein [Acidaminococcaceae bacterium]